MAAFLGDIAFVLETAMAVAGLVMLHRAAGDPRPALLKVAGIVLLVAGAGAAICTAYYYSKYHFAGDLDHPYPVSAGAMSMMMGTGGTTPPAPDAVDDEHKAHHPESTDNSPE